MEKFRKGDNNRTSRNEAHCSHIARDESDTTRSRICRRFVKLLGGRKTKHPTQKLLPADVQVSKLGVESSDRNEVTRDTASDHNLDLLISNEILRSGQEETKWDTPCPEVDNKWEEVENNPFIESSFVERKSLADVKTLNDSQSVPSTEVSSNSAVIVVDDSKCDTSWQPPGCEAGLERISSLLNSSRNVSVESQLNSSASSGNLKECIPSGSRTAEDLAETLAAHIAARERKVSAALSFSSHFAKEVTEWKRDLLHTDSTESLLGWLTGPSSSVKCVDVSNVQSSCHGSAGCFASNANLSSSVFPEDDREEQELGADELFEKEILGEDIIEEDITEEDIIEEDDEEDAVTAEPSDPLSEEALSSASLRASFRASSLRTKCWKSDLIDATTSIQSGLALPLPLSLSKVEVSTATTPTESRLRASDVTHFDEMGFPSKRQGLRVKWGGGWSSTGKENSTTKISNAVSSISLAPPSERVSSPGLSVATVDNLSTLTFSEELDFHLPRPTYGHKDAEAVQKLTQLLEELSVDEQTWLGDLPFGWTPEDLSKYYNFFMVF